MPADIVLEALSRDLTELIDAEERCDGARRVPVLIE